MKKKALIFSLFIFVVPFALTSCKVNWFDKQYDAPWWVIAIYSAVIFIVASFLSMKYITSREYICPNCGEKFHPKWWQTILSIHVNRDRLFKCPSCGKRSICKITRKSKKE